MKKRSHNLRWLIAQLSAILIFLTAICIYYFNYVPSQEAYYTNRDFRLLGRMRDQFRFKVENYVTVLDNAIIKAKEDIAEAVKNDKTDNSSTRSAGSRLRESIKNTLILVPGLKLVEDRPPSKSRQTRTPGYKNIKLDFKQEEEIFWLYFEYEFVSWDISRESVPEKIIARTNLGHLIGIEPSQGLFGDIMVAQSDGTVIFQKGASKINLLNLNSLRDKEGNQVKFNLSDVQNGKTRAESNQSGASDSEKDADEKKKGNINQSGYLSEVKLGGEDYKLFIQPARISLQPAGSYDSQESNQYVYAVCGLVPSDDFLFDTLAISYTYRIITVLIILLAILSIPILKAAFMGPKDRLQKADVFLLFSSLLISSALVTFSLLDSYTYLDLKRQMDVQLEAFSGEITKNVEQELVSAYKQLNDFNDKLKPYLAYDKKNQLLPLPPEIKRNIDILKGNETYPYFNLVTWLDDSGNQQSKWSVKRWTTPFIKLDDRPYFKNVREGRLWSLKGDNGKIDFFLYPLISRNTGENLITLSIPTDNNLVATVDINLLSLVGTVVPPGFGFSVIDDSGEVKFHSDHSKNLQENFFEECDQDNSVRSAVFSRVESYVNGSYLGRGHRFFISPMEGLPWTLIVYRDKDVFGTVNLDMITIAAMFFITYSIWIFLVFSWTYREWGIWRYKNRGKKRPLDRGKWVWPHKRMILSYLYLLKTNFALGLIFLVGIFSFPQNIELIIAFLIPALALIITYLKLAKDTTLIKLLTDFLKYKSRSISDKGSETSSISSEEVSTNIVSQSRIRGLNDYRTAYVLSAVALFILISVLPSLAFFKVAYLEEMELYLKFGQLKLAESLEKREARVRNQYSDIKVGDCFIDKERFFEKRLNLKQDPEPGYSDVYQGFFFNTNSFWENVKSCPEPGVTDQTIFDWFISHRPIYNQICVESYELTRKAASDQSWWTVASSNKIIKLYKKPLISRKSGNDDDEILMISSSLPYVDWPLFGINAPLNPLWLVSPIIFTILLYMLVHFIINRVFFLDLDETPDVSLEKLGTGTISQNLLVLGTRSSEKLKNEYLCKDNIFRIDLRKALKGENRDERCEEFSPINLYASLNGSKNEDWVENFSNDNIVNDNYTVLAIDNFEYNMNDPQFNRDKIRFLEKILAYNKTVIVASTVHPMNLPFDFIANNGDDPKSDDPKNNGEKNSNHLFQAAERCKRIFKTFSQVYILDKGFDNCKSKISKLYDKCNADRVRNENVDALLEQVNSECEHSKYLQKIGARIIKENVFEQFNSEQIIQYMLEQAWSYYHDIWATCSRDEKMILYNLAYDRLICSENKDIQRLLKRGLLVRDPNLRLMNESFTRFVISVTDVDEVEAWRGEGKSSIWRDLKIPLTIGLIGVALFIFITQREIYEYSLAFISAIVMAIASLWKLFGLLQGKAIKIADD